MSGSDIMNELHDNNCFTNTCAAKQTDLTAKCIRSDQVNDFNPVSKILVVVACWSKVGAGLWIGQ